MIRTVDPREAYDKDNLVNAMEDIGSLESVLKATSQEPWDPEAAKKLGALTRDDPRFYAGLNPRHVANDTNEVLDENLERIRKYAKRHFSSLFDELSGKALLALAQSLPLEETGDENLDNIAKAILEIKKVQEAGKSRDGIRAYVASRMKDAPKWMKTAYEEFSSGDFAYIEKTFEAYVETAQVDYAKAIQTEGGRIRKDKLYDLVSESYEKVKANKGENSKEAKLYEEMVARLVGNGSQIEQLEI